VQSKVKNLWLSPAIKQNINTVGLHRVAQKSKLLYVGGMVDNFGKYGPISIILSLLQSVMNCGKYGNKSCHLTSNMLPHYLVKVESSTVQLVMFT